MKETEEIYEEMKNELERRSGAVLSSDGEMSLRLHAVAAELSTLWAQVDWTRCQSFPQTASGETLELHAAARGLERAAAVKSAGSIRFSLDAVRSDAVSVPLGTVCLNAAGLEFETKEAGSIAAGALSCEVKAEARAAGSAGNVPAGSVCFFSLAPVGVAKCTNANAFTGGSDIESDEALRQRVLESFASLPNGSNRAYYEAAALDTEGVGAVSVQPRVRGVGTVDVVVASPAGLPSEATIKAVKTKLEAQREICVDVSVLAPTTVEVPVAAAISVDDGEDFDTVAARVKSAVEQYFNGKLLGKSVLTAKLGSLIFSVEGVSNCTLSKPAADVAISYSQLPVAGTVTISRR